MEVSNFIREEIPDYSENRSQYRCTCEETGNPNEFGDGSSLPCMSMDPAADYLHCSNCIYCQKKG